MNQALVETRAAAAAHDTEKAIRALSVLSEIATHEAQAGRLSAAEQHALRTGIAQARRRVELDVIQPTPPPDQPAPVPQGAPEQQGEAPDKDVKDNKQNKDARGDKPDKAKDGNGKGKG